MLLFITHKKAGRTHSTTNEPATQAAFAGCPECWADPRVLRERHGLIRDEAGFSLTELLVVLVIIGVLVALLALPRFTSVMTKAKSTEARLMLRQVHSLQQAYYFEHNVYTDDLDAIGFEQAALQTDGGSAYYEILLEGGPDEFRAVARASVDFDRDGVFNEWEVASDGAIKETVRD